MGARRARKKNESYARRLERKRSDLDLRALRHAKSVKQECPELFEPPASSKKYHRARDRYKTQSYNFLTHKALEYVDKENLDWAAWIANFWSMISVVITCADEGARRTTLSLWMQNEGLGFLESTVASILLQKITSGRHVQSVYPHLYYTQAISDEIDRIGDILEYTFDSAFADSVRNLFVSAACLRIFDRSTAEKIYRYFGRLPTALPVYELMRICIKSTAQVVKVCEDVSEGVPLCDALFRKDKWIHAVTKTQDLIFKKDHLYSGVKVEGKYPKKVWQDEVEEILIYLKDRKSKTSSLKKGKYMEICQMITTLETLKSEVIAETTAGNRQMPYGIIIGEDPGIGKSVLLSLLAYQFCYVKGYPYTADMIYHVNKNSDFHDGLKNQVIYHFSEMGSETKEYAKNNPSKKTLELTSIMDSVAGIANMASLEDKAKVYFSPELVMGDVNNMSMNFDVMVCNQAAFLRRFVYVIFKVLHKYRKDNSCSLDPAKVAADPPVDSEGRPCPTNLYSIHVYRQVPITASKYYKQDILVDADIFKFVKWYREDLAKHFESQDYVTKLYEDNAILRPVPGECQEFDKISVEGSVNEAKNAVNNALDSMGSFFEDVKDNAHGFKNMLQSYVFGTPEKNFYEPPPANYFDEFDDLEEYVEFETGAHKTSEMYNLIDKQTSSGNNFEEKEYFVTQGLNSNFSAQLNATISQAKQYVFVKGKKHLLVDLKDVANFSVQSVRSAVANLRRLPVFINGLDSNLVLDTITDTSILGVIDRKIRCAIDFTSLDKQEIALYSYLRTIFIFLRFFLAFILSPIFPRWYRIQKRTTYQYMMWQHIPSYNKLTMSLLAISSTFLIYSFYKKKKKENELDSVDNNCSEGCGETFAQPSTQAFSIEKLEKLSDCKSGDKRISIRNYDEAWNIQLKPRHSAVHVGDMQSLATRINENIRHIVLTFTNNLGTDIVFPAKCLGIYQDYILMPNHYIFQMPDIIDVIIYNSKNGCTDGSFIKMKLNATDFSKVSEDLVVFRTRNKMQFSDIRSHIVDDIPTAGKGYIKGQLVNYVKGNPGLEIEDISSKEKYKAIDYFTYNSDNRTCGWVLVGEVTGKSHAILGMHVAGSNSGNGVSLSITRKQIDNACNDSRFTQALNQSENPSLIAPIPVVLNDLDEPITKSAFRHEPLPFVAYFGRNGKVEANNKSRLTRSVFGHKNSNFARQFSDIFGVERTTKYIPPVMDKVVLNGEWNHPYNVWYRKVNRITFDLDSRVMRKCIDVFEEKVFDDLGEKGVEVLSPYPFKDAINGNEDDPFFKRVNASTSSGFGFNGKKNKHLILQEDGITRVASVELEELVIKTIETLADGNCVNFCSVTSLKDEPRSIEKVKKCKTRVFYVPPLVKLIVGRMYLGPLFTLMVQYSESFCCALGINMHREGAALFERLDRFAPDFIEGDWEGFDTSMPIDIAVMTNTFIYEFLKHFGYNEFALKVVAGYLSESIWSYLSVLSDIVCVPGLKCSGDYATAEENCLRNIFIFLYFWYSHPELQHLNFFDWVLMVLYGDDALGAVKGEVKIHFNNRNIAKFAKDTLGMGYTSAKKDGLLDDFVTIYDSSFLKRSYKIHPSLNVPVSPLDVDSIYKMLEWYIPSDSITTVEQMNATCMSALTESFFILSEKKYNLLRDCLLEDMSMEFKVSENDLKVFYPTFDFLRDRYFPHVTTQSTNYASEFEENEYFEYEQYGDEDQWYSD